jgi:diguanylate cyclase (GGDEF)-like protein
MNQQDSGTHVSVRRVGARQADWLVAMTDTVLRDSAQNGASQTDTLATIAGLVHAATHDLLTGLPTRGVLIAQLERELERGTEGRDAVAVLFIDLDNFKRVNDSLGHQSGDELLREMARRIRACVAEGDLLSRFGGDELVILHPHAHGGSEDVLAAKVLAAMGPPIQIAGREMVMSVSIGIAINTPGAQSAEQLLRDADTALYAAKNRGRNRMERFNDELHAQAVRRMGIESDLRAALRDAQIHVNYQPQVNLSTGELVGVEALARWRHPEHGLVPPSEFIPIAEDCRLINELGHQVLRSACQQLAHWVAAVPGRPLSMTVNISPRQLDDPGFLGDLRQIIEETGIDPALLCLELTESALMNPGLDIVGTLERARSMGVYVAIDDFGTKHSSLARLRDLPVEVLKIDKSFIDGLPVESGDTAIVSSILSMAFAMGKHVIAEGVEREEQAQALRRMGCQVAQGYLFSKPVEAAAILPLLQHALWQPPANGTMQAIGVSPNVGGRRARRTFIDEFLDHIGAPMWDQPERST